MTYSKYMQNQCYIANYIYNKLSLLSSNHSVTVNHSLVCFILSAPFPIALTCVGPAGRSVNTALPNDPKTVSIVMWSVSSHCIMANTYNWLLNRLHRTTYLYTGFGVTNVIYISQNDSDLSHSHLYCTSSDLNTLNFKKWLCKIHTYSCLFNSFYSIPHVKSPQCLTYMQRYIQHYNATWDHLDIFLLPGAGVGIGPSTAV